MGDRSRMVTVSCSDHHQELVNGLWNFLNTKYRVDFDVQWSGRSVRAHQLILDVFLPPEKLDRRALSDKRSNLDSLLEFMYRGTVVVRHDELDNLSWAAKKLGFKMLAAAVEAARRGGGRGGPTDPARDTDAGSNRRQRRGNAAKRSKLEPQPVDDNIKQAEVLAVVVDTQQEVCTGEPETVGLEPPTIVGEAIGDVSEWHGIIEALNLDWEIPTTKGKPSDIVADDGGQAAVAATKTSYVDAEGCALSPAEYMRLWRQKQPFVKCEHCNYKTRYKRDYGAHLAKHHPGVPVPRCQQCRQTFFDQKSLALHQLKQHPADLAAGSGAIDVTQFVFTNQTAESTSASTTTMTSPLTEQQQPTADVANFASLSETERKRLYRQRQRQVQCSHCDYATRDRRHYGSHLAKHHPGVPVPKCPVCKQTFFDQESLTRHKLKKHLMDNSSGLEWLTIDESACSTSDGGAYSTKTDTAQHLPPVPVHPVQPVSAAGMTKAERNRMYRQSQRLVKCDHCEYKTRDKRYYGAHLAKHHPGVPVPRCQQCRQTFFDQESLARHRMKQHLMVHSAEAIRARSEPGDGLAGEEEEEEDSEQKKAERDEKRLSKVERDRLYRQNRPLVKCDHCEYKTRDKRYYATHLTRHHPSSVSTKCESCQRAFPDAESLAGHHRKYAADGCSAVHKCPHCYYETPAQINMYRHLYARHGVNARGKPVLRKHRCSECDYAALIPSQLKNHVLAKHSGLKPFKCQRCPYATYHKGARDNHVRKVHLGLKPYLCDTCGHRSASQCNLDRHRRTHTGERPFVCSQCGLAFADRYTLNGHVRSKHTQERPFVCHVCAHAFRRLDNLRVHLKKVHQTR